MNEMLQLKSRMKRTVSGLERNVGGGSSTCTYTLCINLNICYKCAFARLPSDGSEKKIYKAISCHLPIHHVIIE